jgi:hypothetical protein
MKPMPTIAASSLVLSALATVAAAQPALAPLEGPAEPTPAAPSDLDYRDPGVATALSIGGTLVPIALVVAGSEMDSKSNTGSSAGITMVEAGLAGMVLGPSLGHWYAHDYLTPGLGMRAGGGALIVYGLVEALSCGFDESTGCSGNVATAGRTATSWNAAHVRVLPTMMSSNGHSTMGVGLGGTF